ncbi:MAG: nitroreductase family protein [Candidatus Thorarchaeota archaeon]
MTIDGIDQETCSNCYSCIQVCPATLYKKMEDGSVKFLTNQFCIKCGHCVSACPEDAIIRNDMDDVEDFPVGKNVDDFVKYGDLMNLFRGKRSLRRYKKKKVDDNSLDKIFKAIRYAPSGGNSRMWRFVLVSNQEKIEILRERIIEEVSKVNPRYAKGYHVKKKLGMDPIFFDAPHLLILYYPPNSLSSGINSGIALTYGMLAAESIGVGSCWIGVAHRLLAANEDLRNMFYIDGIVGGVITLGYPAIKYYRFPSRSPLKILKID